MACQRCGGAGSYNTHFEGDVTTHWCSCDEGKRTKAKAEADADKLERRNKRVWEKYNNRKKGGCFLTTAICNGLGKDDDCTELQAMRDFRDNILLTDPQYCKLVYEYYDISQFLIGKLEKLEQENCNIHKELYDQFITSILLYLERSEYASAIQKYQEMVLYISTANVVLSNQ